MEDSNQIPNFSCSPSQVSEPPDVRNWFSSYVYESFVLDTNDDVKESAYQESEFEKERFIMGENQKEQDNMDVLRETSSRGGIDVGQETAFNALVKSTGSLQHENVKSLSKISDFLDSPSLFSEPPDVKNWFSSYVYESPEFDTSNEFKDSSVHKLEKEESAECSSEERGEKVAMIRNIESRDKEGDVEKEHSVTLGDFNSSLGVNEKVNCSENTGNSTDRNGQRESIIPQNNYNPVFLQESLEDTTLQKNSMISSKNDKISSFNNEDSMFNVDQEYLQKAFSVPSNIKTSPQSNRNKSTVRLLDTAKSKQEGIIGASLRKHTHEMIEKENEGKQIMENGYVTTRKNRCLRTEPEDCWKRPGKIPTECTRNKEAANFPTGEMDAFVKRKALMEITNGQHSNAMVFTGKWRCPQKSKPDRGPPLKQLRLERWVQRL